MTTYFIDMTFLGLFQVYGVHVLWGVTGMITLKHGILQSGLFFLFFSF